MRDNKNRSWKVSYQEYAQGWMWSAQHKGQGISSGSFFATRAEAVAEIQSRLNGKEDVYANLLKLSSMVGAAWEETGAHCKAVAKVNAE